MTKENIFKLFKHSVIGSNKGKNVVLRIYMRNSKIVSMPDATNKMQSFRKEYVT